MNNGLILLFRWHLINNTLIVISIWWFHLQPRFIPLNDIKHIFRLWQTASHLCFSFILLMYFCIHPGVNFLKLARGILFKELISSFLVYDMNSLLCYVTAFSLTAENGKGEVGEVSAQGMPNPHYPFWCDYVCQCLLVFDANVIFIFGYGVPSGSWII